MNTTLFRVFMVKNHEKQTELAEDMDMSQSALSNRINGKNEWKKKEINFFRNRWNLTDQETIDIFFNSGVSEIDTGT